MKSGTLNLPPQAEVEGKLLQLLAARSRPLTTTEVYRSLADIFNLSLAQRDARRERGNDPAWNWLVRRAMQRLVAKGWADHRQHASWAATEKGRSIQQEREKIIAQGGLDLFGET